MKGQFGPRGGVIFAYHFDGSVGFLDFPFLGKVADRGGERLNTKRQQHIQLR